MLPTSVFETKSTPSITNNPDHQRFSVLLVSQILSYCTAEDGNPTMVNVLAAFTAMGTEGTKIDIAKGQLFPTDEKRIGHSVRSLAQRRLRIWQIWQGLRPGILHPFQLVFRNGTFSPGQSPCRYL